MRVKNSLPTMQQTSHGPRRLVSPLPSPATSQADSNFSVSRYAAPRQTPRGVERSESGSYSQRVQLGTIPANGFRSASSNTNNESPAPGGPPDEARILDDSLAKKHWSVFRSFLSNGHGPSHARQNKARDKLTRLSRTQFTELSTDVHDEVKRRSNDSINGFKTLQPNAQFHPKRNQAREKLATLQRSQLMDLASDILYEIERRFPSIGASTEDYNRSITSSHGSVPSQNASVTESNDTAPPLKPEARRTNRQNAAFRQTAVIPNKSTMMEEDNESDYESDLKSPRIGSDHTSFRSLEQIGGTKSTQSNSRIADEDQSQREITELREKVRKLELGREEKESNIPISRQMKREMEELLERNDRLEEENVALKASQSLETAETVSLKKEIEQLKAQLDEQQQITEEVRSEAQGFLDEMRGLSERETEIYERAANLESQVATLEAETREWKERYQKSQTQLRKLKATSQFFSPTPENVTERTFIAPEGIIRDIAIVKFQLAIDSLLRNCRTNIPVLMDSMKDVVIAIRSIQIDLDAAADATIMNDTRVIKLRQKMSTTANNLMTAVKNHISGGNISPVSLVDAAASHLSSAVIEIAKICKLRATQENGDLDTLGQPELSSRNHGKAAQSLEHGLLTPPPKEAWDDAKRSGSTFDGKDLDLSSVPNGSEKNINEDVRVFLEDQTENIVSSIQQLLSAIRADARPQVLQAHMGEIVTIVGLVSTTMREAFESSSSLKSQAGMIVDVLDKCTSRIKDMQTSASINKEQQASKEFKQKLAGIAFDTAKQTKELSIVLQGVGDESPDLT